jgi:hypothetical protein
MRTAFKFGFEFSLRHYSEGPTHLHEQFGYDNAIFPAEAVRGGCIGSAVVAAADGMYRLPAADIWAAGRGLHSSTFLSTLSRF